MEDLCGIAVVDGCFQCGEDGGEWDFFRLAFQGVIFFNIVCLDLASAVN